MWAVAKYDLGLSLEEFEELTPGMFRALCERRNIRFKYDRYANALTAAAVYNVNRMSEDTPVVSAMDFVRDGVAQQERERKRNVWRACQGLAGVRGGREKLLEARARLIASLQAQGHADAEEICDKCWPSLKPAKEEHE